MSLTEVQVCSDELDRASNLGMVKDGADVLIHRELRNMAVENERPVKVILKAAYLDQKEIRRMVEVFKKSDAHFIKTSTGFGPRDVSVEDATFLEQRMGSVLRSKPPGGVRICKSALAVLEAGAN